MDTTGQQNTPRRPVAVVTGAGSGIGRVITNSLWAADYRVVLLGRRRATLTETVATANRDTATALVAPADVTSESDVTEVFRQAVNSWGRVDLLVNNAGVFGPTGDPDEIDATQWRTTVDSNLTGAFLCARDAFRDMKEQHIEAGRIITNGAGSAPTPRAG